MSAVALRPPAMLEPLRRLAALEYALIEACHAEAPSLDGSEQAWLAARAGAAQVHVFDLGTVLRELGDDSFLYSRGIRQALLHAGSSAEVLLRLETAYRHLLQRGDLPAGLQVLLRANLIELDQLRRSHDATARLAA